MSMTVDEETGEISFELQFSDVETMKKAMPQMEQDL